MSNDNQSSAINLSKSFLDGADMSHREKAALEEISDKTGFIPKKVIWKSSYWGTEQIGAVHYLGIFDKHPAVLKIQGIKPDVSEVFMIKQFTLQNRSNIIRPPKILKTIKWDDKSQYEAVITEYVEGQKVLQSGQLHTPDKINSFFEVYKEYRQNCLPHKPWLSEPKTVHWQRQIEKVLRTARKAYPDDPRRKESDKDLVIEAARLLNTIYSNVSREFIHGHFSVEDLVRTGENIVLFSNLFWKWQWPFYDAVFGYHWFMYGLAKVDDITYKQIEDQRNIWLDALFSLPEIVSDPQSTRLLEAALLERATSGLIIDSFLVDVESSVAQSLTNGTREQMRKLMDKLSSSNK